MKSNVQVVLEDMAEECGFDDIYGFLQKGRGVREDVRFWGGKPAIRKMEDRLIRKSSSRA
jgi:hypothetical protein